MLYPEALRGILLFRGLVPVADEQLDDITCLLAAWESQTDAAQPMETYFQSMQAALAPPPEIAAEALPAPEAGRGRDRGKRPRRPPRRSSKACIRSWRPWRRRATGACRPWAWVEKR
jgi:hypothetical protein